MKKRSFTALLLAICKMLSLIPVETLALGEEKSQIAVDVQTEEVQVNIRKKIFWRILSLVPAIGAVIAFILTEDMRLDMVIIDRWTLLMVVIALVQILLVIFSKKNSKEEKNEEESEASLT